MASIVRTMSSEASAGHVLLGGGTGFIGSAFKYLLNCNGYQVTTISRMPGPDRITWIDVSSNGLPKGITAVVNLAGQNILDPMCRWNDAFKQNVRNSRIKTTQTLAQAITKAEQKPKVFVSMSGVGVYKPDEKASYDECSDVSQSFDFLSQLALEWEAAARLPEGAESVRQVVIRSGIVLGRNGGMIKQVYLPFWFCVGGPIGSGTQFMPWIHVYDMCHILLFAIENSKASGVINGVAPQIITNSDFTKAFAGALHRPAFIPLPALALRLIFGEERSKIMTEGQQVHPKRLNELNFKFKYTNIDQAYENKGSEIHTWHQPVNIPALKHCKNLTDLLIHIITQPNYLSQLNDRAVRKKDVWLAVARQMKKIGYPLSTESDNVAADKCNQKLRNLKKTYYKHLQSGNRDESNLPKYMMKLPKLFGWSADDIYRSMGREFTFLEAGDISTLVKPRELVNSVGEQKKKLPRIIIFKPGKSSSSHSSFYPATPNED